MKGFWLPKILGIVAFTALAIGVFGFIVMSLWNWLVPAITGWHTLTLVQALGLLVLCRILFGGLGRGRRGWGGGFGHWGGTMAARFGGLSPEEGQAEHERMREQMRARMRERFAGRWSSRPGTDAKEDAGDPGPL
jgi:hypothetical protein